MLASRGIHWQVQRDVWQIRPVFLSSSAGVSNAGVRMYSRPDGYLVCLAEAACRERNHPNLRANVALARAGEGGWLTLPPAASHPNPQSSSLLIVVTRKVPFPLGLTWDLGLGLDLELGLARVGIRHEDGPPQRQTAPFWTPTCKLQAKCVTMSTRRPAPHHARICC